MADLKASSEVSVPAGRQRAQLAYLKKVADQIKEEDKKVQAGLQHSLKHALQAGKLLAESKKLVGHGGWLAWFEESNFPFKERTAQRYMSVYQRWKELAAKVGSEANPTALTDLTFTEAIELLAEQKAKTKAKPKTSGSTLAKTTCLANGTANAPQPDQTMHRIEMVQVGPQRSDHWQSPEVIVELAVSVLGRIDLDPAADDEKRIGASMHFTKSDDGLDAKHPWRGRVFLNPPTETSTLERFAKRMLDEYHAKQISEAILLIAAMTDVDWLRSYAAFPRVFVRQGAFDAISGMPDPLLVIYLGPNTPKFFERFLTIGDGFVAYQRSE